MKYNPVAKNAHKYNKCQVHKNKKKDYKRNDKINKSKIKDDFTFHVIVTWYVFLICQNIIPIKNLLSHWNHMNNYFENLVYFAIMSFYVFVYSYIPCRIHRGDCIVDLESFIKFIIIAIMMLSFLFIMRRWWRLTISSL